MNSLVRVDKRGRLVIPFEIRKRLEIRSVVPLQEKNGNLELIPVSDPLKNLKGSVKTRLTPRQLDRLAESIIKKEAVR